MPKGEAVMTVTLRVEALTDLLVRALVAHRMSPENARIVASVVAAAERDASRSHGLFRLPGYIATLRSGWVDGMARPKVADAAPGVVATDAMNGFAQVALAASRDLLERKAREVGIASLAIRNSHHFAALWADVEPFAEAGFVAMAFVNARGRIAPFGAKRKLLGTNPMAFACPRQGGLPMVWDQASSGTAHGEILLAARAGHTIPEGVAVDVEGHPTTDPEAVLQGGAMLPFAGHKGSAIALMVEIMAAALTGGRFGFEDHSADFPGAETSNAGECIILIDPRHFAGADFAERLDGLFSHLSAGGVARLPADRRHAARAKADQLGITVTQSTYEYLCSLLPSSDPEYVATHEDKSSGA
jgi:delta1-piperideine-2-carboxylate reductase